MSTLLTKLILSEKVYRASTSFNEWTHRYDSHIPTFIFGCQRSGTTIVQKLIRIHPSVRSYGEGEPPYFDQKTNSGLILSESKNIKYLLKREKNRYILLKPLYESHKSQQLLDEYTGSKGLWVYRNHRDVIDSHIKYYKMDGCKYISSLLSQQDDWMSESIDKDMISSIEFDRSNSADCYALFWYIRNLHFSENHLHKLKLVNYDKLVCKPAKEAELIYKHLDLKYYSYFSKMINTNSYSKTFSYNISPALDNLCTALYSKLDDMKQLQE